MASTEASFEIETQLSMYQSSALFDKFYFRVFVITNFNHTVMCIANKLTIEEITKKQNFNFSLAIDIKPMDYQYQRCSR